MNDADGRERSAPPSVRESADPASRLPAGTRRAALAMMLATPWVALRAQQSQAPIRVRYGGDRDFPPFERVDENGAPRGFQIDLLRELAVVTGLEFDIRLDDWPAVERAFRNGELDLVAMAQTRPRADWAAFARPHATPVLAVYHRADEPSPTSLGDLAGRTIAVVASEPMRETVADHFPPPRFRVVEVDSAAAALAAVHDREADVALMPRAVGRRLVAKVPGVRAADIGYALQAYAFAVAPDKPELLARIERGLAELEASGRLETLRTRWLESHRLIREREALLSRTARERFAVGGALTGAMAVIVALAVYARRRARLAAEEATRRKASEAALAAAEERLNRTFMAHPDGMAITEVASGRIIEVNAALSRLLGRPPEALVGLAPPDFGGILDPGALAALMALFTADGRLQAAPLVITTPDGKARHCLVTSEPIEVSGVACAISILRDVTEAVRRDTRLRAGYARLEAEVAEQARTHEQTRKQLAETRERLEAVARVASHDLRAPLRTVAGFSTLLRADITAGRLSRATGYLDRIDQAVGRMDRIISGFSRLAGDESDPPRRELVDMTAQAAEAWDLVRVAEAERAVRFRLAPLPPARADPAMVSQIWQNLLDNAFKYTRRAADPVVTVDSFVGANRTWYRVSDNGAGFDTTFALKLFEPFERVHSDKEFPGTGIGLWISRQMVRRHGGDIRAQSTPGTGAIFEFCLEPLSDPAQ